MIKFYMLALILVLIVAFGSAPTMEEQIADAQHMHQLLKTLDVASQHVHSVIDAKVLKDRYKQFREMQKEERRRKKENLSEQVSSKLGAAQAKEESLSASSQKTRKMQDPGEIFLPDDKEKKDVQETRAAEDLSENDVGGELERLQDPHNLDFTDEMFKKLEREKKDQTKMQEEMLYNGDLSRMYKKNTPTGLEKTSYDNMKYVDQNFEYSTKNDYLTLLETKRFARMNDRKLLDELAQNITRYANKPHKVISQAELIELLRRGTISENQAFLIFELFHLRMVDNGLAIQSDRELYIYGGTVPVCRTLNLVLLLIFIHVIITQNCLEKDHSPMILQFSIASTSYGFALDFERQGLGDVAFICHWVFDILIYFIMLNTVRLIGYDASDYDLDIFTERNKRKKQVGGMIFNGALVAISFISCLQFSSPTVYFFFSLYLAFFVFRIANFVNESVPVELKPFPLFNLPCSALILLVMTLKVEIPDVSDFSYRPDVYDQMQEEPEKYLPLKQTEYLQAGFVFLVALFLHYNMIYQSLNQSASALQSASESAGSGVEVAGVSYVQNILDDQMINYQRALALGYPKGLPSQSGSFFVWGLFIGVCSMTTLLGLAMRNDRLLATGIYCLLELLWEFQLITPHWMRRKIMVLEWFVKDIQLNNNNPPIEQAKIEKEEDKLARTIGDQFTRVREKLMFIANYGMKVYLIWFVHFDSLTKYQENQ